jgi:hypothetical protein
LQLSSPYINRFLSPDTIVPGAANPQALNRYSYVLGNPLKYVDPTGHGQCQTQEDCEDMGTTPMGTGGSGGGSTPSNGGGGNPHNDDDFDPYPNGYPGSPTCYPGELVCQLEAGGYEPKTQEEILNDIDNIDFGDGTIQYGYGIVGFYGVGIRGDIAIAIDFKGSIALIVTGGGGGYAAAGGGVGPYLAVTNAPSVAYLNGNNVQFGGQVGEVGSVGTEVIKFRGADREIYSGISISGAVSFQGPWPCEIHATATNTSTLVSINIPDLIVSIFR